MLQRATGPLYHQLKQLLTEKIESGEWGPGHRLPTEMELSREFSVSRATVRQAMALLENQGLVERFQGRGTFVGRPKFGNDLMQLFSPMRGMTGVHSVPDLIVDEFTIVTATALVASRLRLSVEEQVYELKRHLQVDGEPLMLIRNWLPVSRFPDLGHVFAREKTIWGSLRSYDIVRTVQHKEIEVTILDEEEAEALDTRVGAPALLVTYLTSLPEGEPIEYRRLIVRGDRVRYYVDQESAEFLV